MTPIDKIIFVRKQMGYTQSEFAMKIGRTLDTIKNIESGRTPIKNDILQAISDFTQIPVKSFTTGAITTNSIKFTNLTEKEFKLNSKGNSRFRPDFNDLTVADLMMGLSMYSRNTIVGFPRGFTFRGIRNDDENEIIITFQETEGVDYVLKEPDEDLISRDALTEQTKMLRDMLKEKDKTISNLHELIGEMKHQLAEMQNLKNKPRVASKTPRNYK